jgi:glutamate/tyrosine decarboxylase-like PLP-dependent enzyme
MTGNENGLNRLQFKPVGYNRQETTPMSNANEFESLDPKDWDEIRQLAHRMIDSEIDHIKSVAERPAWQPVPESVAAHFTYPAPREPGSAESAYNEFLEFIRPYPMGNTHPRFWSWYMGNGTLTGALADFLAAMMNSNMGGGNHVSNLVEGQVINWMKDLLGFPAGASGLLVSGGSMANLTALNVARHQKSDFDIRKQGLYGDSSRMQVYASTEVHNSNQKALELMGMGAESLHHVAVNDDYTMNLEALQRSIENDRAAGHKPIAVIGTPGTINTGAVDDLSAIADICERENLWFHVDGAIGAVAVLSKHLRPQLAGIERADSVALDLHKWLHVPFEAGCVLVRPERAQLDSFSLVPEYLAKESRGLAAGDHWFSDLGIQLSRQFRALKVWMTIKEHGLDRLGRMMDRNVEQAHYLGRLVEDETELELMAPIGMDIVCYRFNPGRQDKDSLTALNKEILLRLQEQGIAAPSYTTLNGEYCLRVAIANFRSRNEDFELLVHETLRIGRTLQL